jgi:hypothetical protein
VKVDPYRIQLDKPLELVDFQVSAGALPVDIAIRADIDKMWFQKIKSTHHVSLQ